MEINQLGDLKPSWWQKQKSPWNGELFNRMILTPDSSEEQRIQKIRDEMLPRFLDGKYRLSCTQAVLVTESYKETEGQHPAIRRAQAVKKVMEEIPLGLVDGQLFMGNSSSGPHVVDFNPMFLPLDPDQWEDEPESMQPMKGADARYIFLSEDQKDFEEIVWPYWKTRCKEVYLFNELKNNYPEAWHFLRFGMGYRISPLVGGGLAHTIQDKGTILALGLVAVKTQIQTKLDELRSHEPQGLGDLDRVNQYQAMLIAADSIIIYSERNARFAEDLAKKESDPARKLDLLEMARICRKVPAEPSGSWREALQSFLFLRNASAIGEGADSHSAGRFDQYMLRYLEKDLKSGAVTIVEAQLLLEAFFIKWNESRAFNLSASSSGGGNNDKINIGGMDERGRDATNSLSWMLLEAGAHVHLIDPNLSVRLHRGTPDDFLRATMELIRLGNGQPILINDDVIIPALTSQCGVSLDHARHYGDVGCQENITDPNMTGADTNGRTNSGWINLPKPIELALHNGINPLNGVKVGPSTGDPRSFTSMDQFVSAVRIQVEHLVEMNVIVNNAYDFVFTRNFPCVFHNLLHPGTRFSGIDYNAGGCTYNWTGCLAVGTATGGDTLSAIDELIFRTGETTWNDLLTALDKNWVGYDSLHNKCIAAPKYGCDNPAADDWVHTFLEMWFDAYESHSTPRGGRFVVGLISMANYVPLGHWLGATPDGRKAGERLADSTSPSHLAPNLGPTATHRSAARAIDALHVPNGLTFNQRLNATAVTSPRDLAKWADLVRGYMDAGGMEVQYTVVSGEQLRDAQKNPSNYRDLIVRVGGYSAVFVELNQEVQESIIARAELAF